MLTKLRLCNKFIRIYKRIPYEFCVKKQHNNNTNNQQLANGSKIEEQPFSQQQQNLINSHKPDQLFNSIVGVSTDYNFQKELIKAHKEYGKSKKQLKSAILFEDLLKTELEIPIYDTRAKPFYWHISKIIGRILLALYTSLFIYAYSNKDEENRVLWSTVTAYKWFKYYIYFLGIYSISVALFRHLRFVKRYVQKIVYNTQKQHFIFTKRKFWGNRSTSIVSRYKIIYTENQFLNKKGTNYFHIETKQEYAIGYKDAWKKEDLFSHLIAQRIKV